MRLLGHRADHSGFEWLENLQLVPQIFRLLTPFMQTFRRALRFGNGKRLACSTVDTPQARAQHGPSVPSHAPVPRSLVSRSKLLTWQRQCSVSVADFAIYRASLEFQRLPQFVQRQRVSSIAKT